jgi:hypothetical protein
MRLSLAALALSLFAAGAASVLADPSTGTSYQVQNPHGGYNVIQGSAPHQGLAFFGSGGYAAHAMEHAHDKPNFILVPSLEDDGHGKKIVVYKKIYYATPEEAEAAKARQ